MKNPNNKTKRWQKNFKVLENLLRLVAYLAIIFVYYKYIVPFYPLPFTNFWVFISVIVTIIYLSMGVFLFFQFVKSIADVFRKK